jgi:transcriptional regulator with XRE-family HTH domain
MKKEKVMIDLSMNWIPQPTLGDAIRANREQKGISQGDLADAIMKISGFEEHDRRRRNAVQVALSALEHGVKGKRPERSQYLPAIERALGVPLRATNGHDVSGPELATVALAESVGTAKPFEAALKALHALRLDRAEALDGARGEEMRCAIRLIQLCHDIGEEWAP